MKRCLWIFLVVVLVLLGCTEKESTVGEKRPEREASRTVPIGEIIRYKERYLEKDVLVRGRAEPGLAFEFVNEQPYLLVDDTGQIWVITSGVMPERDAMVTVRGTVLSPYQIKGRRYDIVIKENERQ